MDDPFLEAMLKGNAPKIKKADKYEMALERHIKLYFDALPPDDEPLNPLLSPQLQRKKKELELKESLTNLDINNHLKEAVQVVLHDGKRHLDAETYDVVKGDFTTASRILAERDPENVSTDDFSVTLQISDLTIDSIFTIAIAKFEEENYAACLSLFLFLTVLQPSEFDFWYRAGIAAQHCENWELAINAYAMAFDLNQELVEARLFSVQCYIKLGLLDEAEAECAAAAELIEAMPLDEERLSLLADVKSRLATP